MAMQLGHVHIKTREDPQKVAKFYIDNFGATVKREIPGHARFVMLKRRLGLAPVAGGSSDPAKSGKTSRPKTSLGPTLRGVAAVARRTGGDRRV